LLLNELGVNPQTFNLLYFCQTSLVAPIDSTTLKDVHDALCGHVEDEWWKSIGKLLKRKEEVIGVDPWYEVMEDFTLFFDDLFKAFEKFGIKLKETIP
jgi:hypothetical protein